jgi:glycosyltransferase involved in cell wall biosynthesis
MDRESSSLDGVPDIEVKEVSVGVPPARAAAADGQRSLLDITRMSRAASGAGCDVFFFPSSYSYFPLFGCPSVVAIHDAIAERMPHLILPSRRSRLNWYIKQRLAIHRSEAIVTVSEASRHGLQQVLGIPPEKIEVVGEAPDRIFRPTEPAQREGVLERWGIGTSPYLLYVGGISPHKNLERLISAFGKVAREDSSILLVVVGDLVDDAFLSSATSVRAMASSSDVCDRILLTGYVEDDDLIYLYGGALATVMPSLGEGFGLPAAESAACGIPVIASRDAALQELLGDAGIYVDPSQTSELAEAMSRVIADPSLRKAAASAVAQRAQMWSWEKVADSVFGILHRVATLRA